jgi:hypothetical protein
MKNLNNINKESVLYDLKRLYTHSYQVYNGEIQDNKLSKEGAFKRMQVYNYAIKNLK